jgi:hypothetical protein
MKSLRLGLLTPITLIALAASSVARADTVVQVPIDSLLNARPVSTLTNGVVVPWTAGQGVDGNGGGDGFATQAVAGKLGYNVLALPNDGIFPAANGLPEIDLHFSNDTPATSFQAHNAHANIAASIQFAVPQATYSKIFLVMTDSENADMLTVTMTYADSTTSMVGPFTMPDYDQGLPANTAEVSYFSLFSSQKWSLADVPNDNMGHSITGVTLTPTAAKALTGIEIAKPADGHYLVFWGAAGIATSPVDAGEAATDADDASDAIGEEPSSGTSSPAASGAATSGAASGEMMSGNSSGAGSGANAGNGAETSASGNASGASGSGSSTQGNATPAKGSGCSSSGGRASNIAFWTLITPLAAAFRRRRSGRRVQ